MPEKPRSVRPLAFGWPLRIAHGLLDEFARDLGRLFAVGIGGDGVERRDAGALRVGVVHVAAEAFAAEDDHEAMLLHRLDEHLDAGNLHFAELDRQRSALFGGDAAGAAVADVARGVERAEVAADGDVAFLQLEADAGGLERTAADQVLDRVVAEEAQVARSAAGRDAGKTGMLLPQTPRAGERVEIRRFGGFELGQAARLLRQAAKSVADVHDDLACCF